ncbi:MAG: hypothetical protein JWR75_777 [Devosia sp.]|nr:hypothetical protein [Devosia sp.]
MAVGAARMETVSWAASPAPLTESCTAVPGGNGADSVTATR